MDETLVHTQLLSSSNYNKKPEDSECKIAPIATSETESKMAKIFIRPGAREMLAELKSAGFELVLFTAGNEQYMRSVVKHAFGGSGKPIFDHLLCRNDMRILAEMATGTGIRVKDLNCLLEGRFMKDLILIDNSEQKAYM